MNGMRLSTVVVAALVLTLLPLSARADFVPGDTNHDYLISEADIDYIYDVMYLRHPYDAAADLNGDGYVSYLDVDMELTQYIWCPWGDATLDGEVSYADFQVYLNHYRGTGGWGSADFTGDRRVGWEDHWVIKTNWYYTSGGTPWTGYPDFGPGFIDQIYANFGKSSMDYDVDSSGTLVNQADVTFYLHNFGHTGYGDANWDRKTDFEDFQRMLDNWQKVGRDWTEADFTGEGLVDFADFQMLLDYWNPTGWSEPATVPEPATATLLAVGAMALLRRKANNRL